jgi:hypothetical protein
MRKHAALTCAALTLLAAATAQAAMVTISGPTYANANPGEGFGPVSDVTGPGDPVNTTVLAVEVVGFNVTAGAGAVFKNMFDTVSFEVTAPAGYYISRIGYTEGLWTYTTNGLTFATGSLSVEGQTSSLSGLLIPPFTTPPAFDLTFSFGTAVNVVGQPGSVSVAITNQITAVAFGSDAVFIGKGYVDDDGNPLTAPVQQAAKLFVEVAQIPLPASAWLLFTALAGVSVFSRRRTLPGS